MTANSKTRRWFLQRSSAGVTFLLAEFQGLPRAWAQSQIGTTSASGTKSCRFDSALGYAPFIEKFVPLLEPGHDAFVSEAHAATIAGLLDQWRSALVPSPTACVAVVASTLGDSVLATTWDKPQIRSLRSGDPVFVEEATFAVAQRRSAHACAAAFAQSFESFQELALVELTVAELRSEPTVPRTLHTVVNFDLHGTLRSGAREQRTGQWAMTWQGNAAGDWRIAEWQSQLEKRTRVGGPGFVDISGKCFEGVPSYAAQMLPGVSHWRTVMDGASGIDIYGNNGMAAGDYDGDGRDDLYVCQPAGLPNRLYRNRGDGTFEDVTAKAGVGVLDGTASALFVDLENTGRQDLIVVRSSGPLLFVNQGDGTFQLRPDAFQFAHTPQGSFTAIAAADYNRDGLVDLYFCLYSYYQGLSEYQFPQPYYDARNGPPNFLMRNKGGYVFEDVTESSGLMQNNNRYSFACGWNDYNQDGWPDLYVVNDFGRKNLYRNRGDGTFEDVAQAMGVEDVGAGMSVCWFDYDNDGRDDLYVANMWSAAGKRVTTQPEFMPRTPEAALHDYRKHADGNSLFHNAGGSAVKTEPFQNVTDSSSTRNGHWSWSADAWDLDHDGYPELYVTNGFISGPKTQNLSSFFWRQVVARSNGGEGAKLYADAWNAINEFIRSDYSWSGYQRNNVFLNLRDGHFAEAAGVLGLDFVEDSRSFALADFDGDGRVEIALKNRSAPQLRLLHNQMEGLGASISLLLRGSGKSNRDAIGAVVELHTAMGKQRATVRAGSGFLAQHSKRLFFGLGTQTTPMRAVIQWPSGLVQNVEGLLPGHEVEMQEGAAEPRQKAFRAAARYPQTRVSTAPETLPVTFATWLAEPLLPPDFALPDRTGRKHSLAEAKGHPQLLLLVEASCATGVATMQACSAQQAAWERACVRALAVQMDNADSSALVAAAPSIPLVIADATTRGVYSIFYRYLFDRRRDLPTPTALLLDSDAQAIRIYSGGVPADQVLHDLQSAPASTEDRRRAALPFPGDYYGHPLHHNYFTYGVAYLQFGYTQQAKAAFTAAVERSPGYAPAHYNLGLIALNENDTSQAQKELEQAVQLDPASADAWNNLGVVYGQKEDYADAQRCFEKALSLDPAHLLATQNMVKLLQFQGKQEAALALLERTVRRAPDDADLRVGYAMMLFGANDVEQARDQFAHALALAPDNIQALNGMGVLLMRQGDASQAMGLFERCTRVAPDFDRAYLNLAVLYMQAKQQSRARQLLEGFLATHPDNDDIRQALRQVGSQ